jgi:transcriptional regulator of acetoin/glycerol metabolism
MSAVRMAKPSSSVRSGRWESDRRIRCMALTSPRLETVERDAIIEALIDENGDTLKAAGLPGISRATIYGKIHDFGILVEPTATVARHPRGVR